VLLAQGSDGLCSWRGHRARFLLNRTNDTDSAIRKGFVEKFSPASLSRGVRFDQYVKFIVPLVGILLVVILTMLLLDLIL
jgi:hypothetical protein